ncbi:hypothetical protein ACEK07_36835 [Alcanivoracaceae bacterium MT1]
MIHFVAVPVAGCTGILDGGAAVAPVPGSRPRMTAFHTPIVASHS